MHNKKSGVSRHRQRGQRKMYFFDIPMPEPSNREDKAYERTIQQTHRQRTKTANLST